MNVGIIGLGVVGQALEKYNKGLGHTVFGYDIKSDTSEDDLKRLNENTELVFICTSTHSDGKKLDTSSLFNAIGRLEGKKSVIIKSTMNPGTTDELQKMFPQHDIGYSPEFLSELSAYEDVKNPPRPEIFGWPEGKLPVDAEKTNGMQDFYNLPAKQAELVKLATNTFYSMKVIFANILYDCGMSQEALRVLATDPRIGSNGITHFEVLHKGYRGYGGACLPKDTKALQAYIKEQCGNSKLIDSIIEYNEVLRGMNND